MKNTDLLKEIEQLKIEGFNSRDEITNEKRKEYYPVLEQVANIFIQKLQPVRIPIDVGRIIDLFGVSVTVSDMSRFSEVDNSDKDKSQNVNIHALIGVFKDKNNNFQATINVNSADESELNRLGILYCLGLYLFDYKQGEEYFNGCATYDDKDESDYNTVIRFACNTFAYSVLMPREEFSQIDLLLRNKGLSNDERIRELAKIFNVRDFDVKKRLLLLEFCC